jgi:uncharacterized damage-inducible protein DinB
VGPLWIEAFRYHKWANQHLLAECAKLSHEHLEWTAPGTYGTVASTWLHLIGAEQRYIKRLGGNEPRINERHEFPGIAILAGEATTSADELIALAGRIGPDDEQETQFADGKFRLHLGIVLIQALHHGNDHRTHICTILGHHDVAYGDMDVWAYGDATGAIVPIGA